jgi:UDP-glucose 4-epimerase
MKIVITGGAGFVGSYLCEKYVSEGYNVIAIDNLINYKKENISSLFKKKNFTFIDEDITNSKFLKTKLKGIDCIFHLAAIINVEQATNNPYLAYSTNVLGTLNVLENARLQKVPKIIVASSAEIYGTCQCAPMTEKYPLDAPHIYGATKIAVDKMCKAYIDTYNLDIRVLRTFNIFGPRQKDNGYGSVISIFIKRVIDGKSPQVFGDGNQTRDYTYITDLIKAYDLVFKHKKPIKEPLNVGSCKAYKIKDIAKMIINLINKNVQIEYVAP